VRCGRCAWADGEAARAAACGQGRGQDFSRDRR
jgi:hypothetical protein